MLSNFIKTYAIPQEGVSYKHTTMVRHNGVVIALAMDSRQNIWYTVLDLANSDIQSPLDVNYWLKTPKRLRFSKELAHVGYGAASNITMPDPGGRKREQDKTEAEKILATTARLTTDAPFQVVSDGQYVYLFRQSIGADHAQMVKLNDAPIVNHTLLVDRFVFAGNELRPKLEVRYQRSRDRFRPLSRKDSLANKDLEGKPFFEPTQALHMVRPLQEGRFCALLVPTSLPNVRRWQIFSHNAKTGAIDSFNMARDKDGLFDTLGPQFFTCADHPEVFETQSGACPECQKPLEPRVPKEGYAESSLALSGANQYVDMGSFDLAGNELTLTAWVKFNAFLTTGTKISTVAGIGEGEQILLLQAGNGDQIKPNQVQFIINQPNSGYVSVNSATELEPGVWYHLAATYQRGVARLYINGVLSGEQRTTDAPLKTKGTFAIGRSFNERFLNGQVDEVQVWNYARPAESLRVSRNHRLIGNEDGLLAYWRFDEGDGEKVYDQTDNGHHGTIKGAATWVQSDAPIGDNPGVRRCSFRVAGREVTSGLTALLYYQQEHLRAGYDGEPKPMKKAARIMLAVATRAGTSKNNEIATLDIALARDGRLALLPDLMELKTISAGRGGVNYTDLLDEIRKLQGEQIPQLVERDIPAVKATIADLKGRIAQTERELFALTSERDGVEAADKARFDKDHGRIRQNRWFRFTQERDGKTWCVTHIRDADGKDTLIATERAQNDLRQVFRLDFLRRNFECHLYSQAVPERLISLDEGWRNSSLKPPVREGWKFDEISVRWLTNDSLSWNTTKTHILPNLYKDETLEDRLVVISIGARNMTSVMRQAADWCVTLVGGQPPVLQFNQGSVFDYLARECFWWSEEVAPYYVMSQEAIDHINRLTPQIQRKQEEIARLRGELRLREAELARLLDALAKARQRLAELKEAVTGEVALPMPLLSTDGFGLTVSGAVLGFAYSDGAPLLLDSASGKLGLYFRGANGQFFAAYFDTLTQKAVYRINAESGVLGLIARADDSGMDSAAITIAAGQSDATCTLTLSAKGISEVWPELPRDPATFVRILNGNASPLINDHFYYDYRKVTVTPASMSTAYGSTLFRAMPGAARGPVNDQTVSGDGTATLVNRWVADTQGNTLEFDGKESWVGETVDLDRFVAGGHLTLELWVKPEKPRAQASSLIHYNADQCRYLLSLTKQEDRGYKVLVGVADRTIETVEVFPYEKWMHIAAVYHQSYGLRFDGRDDILETSDGAASLNINGDLTVEVFLKTGALGRPQGLLSKGRLNDGSDQMVPYALALDADGTIIFSFEKSNGELVQMRSSTKVVANTFYRLAVTRKQGTDQRENKVAKQFGNEKIEVIESVTVNQWEEVKIYLDGTQVGSQKFDGLNTGRGNQPFELGRSYLRTGAPIYFEGIICEARVWSEARPLSSLGQPLLRREKGLVSRWEFEENQGFVVADSIGENHLNLSGATWVKSPDLRASSLSLYVNGTYQTCGAASTPDYSSKQFTLGASLQGSSPEKCLKGLIEETRIWQTTRTLEEIQDNMFRRLLGEKSDLIAYYQYDADAKDQISDQSGRGNHVTLKNCTYRLSDAPVAYETPQVRNALAGVSTDFHETIGSSPAVQEYSDIQTNSAGEMTGTMKRCYAFIRDGEWRLITGFKIGNIITEWVGQAQFDPQLVGFIEGAPPVPSENLTAAPKYDSDDYTGITSVEVVEAESVTYAYSSSKETSYGAAMSMAASAGMDVEAEMMVITAPLGIGVAFAGPAMADIEVSLGVQASIEGGFTSTNEQSTGSSRSLTRNFKVELSGIWENPALEYRLNQALTRRYQPANIGFALVKSETADIFALRLAHNNALVAYHFQPNPDIPKDWNLIPFPINPRYTKQGTLDGTVGFDAQGVVCDPDYKGARVQGEYSYFKPREAYQLKSRITRETEQERAYFESFSTSLFDSSSLAKGALAGAGAGAIGGGGAGGAAIGAAVGSAVGLAQGAIKRGNQLPGMFSKRNLANTYIWTAGGGFYAESTEFSAVQQETTGGSFSLSGSVGGSLSLSFDLLGAAVTTEMEASVSASLNVTKTKSKEAEQSFSINVEVGVPGDLLAYNEELKPSYDEQGRPIMAPGKVDAYRFMTFYLEPDLENFDIFVNKVVDPIWLAESRDPNAVAVRQAINAQEKARKDAEKSAPWRVFHRVTFVSRILPPIAQSTGAQQVLQAENINSNYELIKRLEPFVRDKTSSYAEFSDAVRQTIDIYMPDLAPAKDHIVEYMALYFQVFDK